MLQSGQIWIYSASRVRKRAIKEDCQVGLSHGRDDVTTKIGKMAKGTGVCLTQVLSLVEMSIRYSNGDAEAEAACNCPELKEVVQAGARDLGINV